MTNSLLFATVAGTGEGNDYADRFLEGEHIIALNNMGEQNAQDYGLFVSVAFIVLESTVPGYAGKQCGEAYFISKSDKEGGKGAKQRMFSLGKAAVQSLGGNPDDQTPAQLLNGQMATKGAALVQNTLAEMCAPGMPWRGLVLRASASKRTGKNSGKDYVAVKFAPVQQTPQQIGDVRKRIEAATLNASPQAMVQGQPTAFAAPAPAAAPQYAQAPAPAQFAPQAAAPQYAQAPAPAQFAQAPIGAPAPAPMVAPAPTPAAAPVAPAPFGGGTSLLGR